MKKQFLLLAGFLANGLAALAQAPSADGTYTAGTPTNLVLRTTTGTTITPRLTILNTNGFIGIGNSAPVDLLHVTGNARANQFNAINGIFNTTAATTNMSFNINSVNKMTLLASNGFLGVGIAAPLDLLHVAGNSRANQFNAINGIFNTTAATTDMAFNINSVNKMTLQASTGALGIGIVPVAGELLHVNGNARANQFNAVNGIFNTIGATTNLAFNTNGTNRMTVLAASGFVGINTPAPSSALHVTGSLRIVDGTQGAGKVLTSDLNGLASWQTPSTSGNTQWITNGTAISYAAGSVGIGTATPNPAYKLDVNGPINATSLLMNGTPLVPAVSGAKQIPFVNLTSSAYSYTSQFTYDAANAVLRVGQGSPTINGTPNNTYILGESATINAANTGGGTVTDAIIGGELNTVGDGVNFFSGSGGVTYGKSNFNYGVTSLVGGYSARTLQGGQPGGSLYAQGTVAIGITEYSGSISTEPVTANAGAINISANTTAQTVGHGAYGNLSAIIGGRNHNVPLTSQRSAILGGDGIKARPNDPDQVYVPNFNIVTTPAMDNTLTQVIVRDGTTGQIKSRDASTMSQWITNGTNINYAVGSVGIGTTLATNPNGYKLAVNGKIGAKDVQVETSSTTWPDYVFAQDYRLPSLMEVEKFIQENNHLENVPSATEIEKNGHSLGEMDKILLKKVEELTLYVIQQQKEIDELKKKIDKKD